MKRRKIFLIAIFLLITSIILIVIHEQGSGQLDFNLPANGFVPNEVTAIKIAEVIGRSIFGKNLNDYKPFHANLENDSIWHVYGLPKKTWTSIQLGGCPEFEIQKKDGKVLKVRLSR